ncbi:unnamed protein product [Peronospora farinosa]|uniref:RxLR effector protein n=1 Tax=Peronospora farinosa TaxID=134698 RepID=A0ABN8C3H0_9STRA|nr:unnamed protein product [Peronospora farinosa]
MRLDSILFVAVLSAFFNGSSTHSVSTPVENIISNQEDDPAHVVGAEPTKEERALPGLDKVIEKVKSMTSSGMEEMVDVNNVVKAYKTLQLHKGIPFRNERYDAWIRYLEMTSSDTLKAELESSGRDGEKKFLKVVLKIKSFKYFKKLELDNGLDKLLDKPNFDLFLSYAAHFEPARTKEAVLIKAARTVYGDIPLGKMLEAASKNDRTATLLLQELDKLERMDAYLTDQLSLSLEELPPSLLANAHV